mgnify:CR=1 FL=1
MGVNQAVAGSVWIVGPAVGGWLAETYGMRTSFVIAGVGSALCSIGYTFLPETLRRKHAAVDEAAAVGGAGGADGASTTKRKSLREHGRAWLKDVRPILASGNQQGLIFLSIIPALRWSCFTTVVALHASETIGAGPQEIGLMFTALALSQVWSGSIAVYCLNLSFSLPCSCSFYNFRSHSHASSSIPFPIRSGHRHAFGVLLVGQTVFASQQHRRQQWCRQRKEIINRTRRHP